MKPCPYKCINSPHPTECDETKCIFCGGYAQFFHNRMSYSCFDCDNHWDLHEAKQKESEGE